MIRVGEGEEDEEEEHKCQIITPTIEYLNNQQILTDVLCTVPNCNQTFSNISALNLHLNKIHKLESIIRNTSDTSVDLKYLKTTTRTKAQRAIENCKCQYYCPAKNCKYNNKIGNGARYLPTFHSLKIHFIRLHGDKMLSCVKCSKKFAIKSELCRHEEKCGQLFKCSCGCPFSTIENLIKHAQIQSHCIPPYNELLTKTNKLKTTHDHDSESKMKIKKLEPATVVDFSSIKNQAPRIIIINNISSTNTQKESTNACNLFKLPYFEPCQRSLGCQTQLINDSKIETASQTPILNVYHSNSMQSSNKQLSSTVDNENQQTTENFEIFKYYETQQTQTHVNDNNLAIHQFDASTSPLNTFNDDAAIINDDQFWAEISTQTFLSVFENNPENQIISNNYNQNQPLISVGTEIPYQLSFSNERVQQSCNVTSNTTYTQTSTNTASNNSQTYTNNSNNELDFIDTIILNSYSTSETQTSSNDVRSSNDYQQLNEDCFIQTNSIQTQTFNEFNELVDNITQTPWDFNINDDLIF